MQVVNTTAMAAVLRRAGLSADLAEAHATILTETVAMSYSGLATKDDILRLDSKVEALFARVETKVEAQIARVEAKVEAQIAQSQNKVILFVVGAALALGGLYINSIRTIPPRALEPVAQERRQAPAAPVPAQPAPSPTAPQK
jgi:hypothetical protein